MKRSLAFALAAAGVAGGSVAVAAVSPFGIASAQDNPPSTQAPAPPAPGAPGAKQGHLAKALAAAVADGTITQDQADKITAKAKALADQFAKDHPKAAGKLGELRGKLGAQADDVAGFLGITADQLRSDLRSGKTLAQIAGDKTQALIDHLVAKANERIDKAAGSGKLPADKVANLKTEAAKRIADMVNGTTPFGKGGRHR